MNSARLPTLTLEALPEINTNIKTYNYETFFTFYSFSGI